MADELPNAVKLMEDDTFRKWCLACISYQVRKVLTEPTTTTDHDVRVRMADAVMPTPESILDRVVNLIATDPAVCGLGGTVNVTNSPNTVNQNLMISKIEEIWAPLAKRLYPTAP